jgi:ribonuclease HI
MEVNLYTDGACSGNPGPGGWGALLRWNSHEKELSGFEKKSTNNRMELMAVIMGLRELKKKCDVTIYSDSKYVIQGASEWMHGWKKKNWIKADKKPVVNKDLWKDLDVELKRHHIEWQWVKGHSGHPENERVDALAVKAIEDNR